MNIRVIVGLLFLSVACNSQNPSRAPDAPRAPEVREQSSANFWRDTYEREREVSNRNWELYTRCVDARRRRQDAGVR